MDIEEILTAIRSPKMNAHCERAIGTEGATSSDNPTARIRKAGLDGSSPTDVLVGVSSLLRDLTLVYHRDLFVFENGFESGGTTAWSNAVP